MDTIVLDVTLSGCVNILSNGKLKGLYTYRPTRETKSFVATHCYAPVEEIRRNTQKHPSKNTPSKTAAGT